VKTGIGFKSIVPERELTFKHLIIEILMILAKKLGDALPILLGRLDDVTWLKAKSPPGDPQMAPSGRGRKTPVICSGG